MDFPPVLKISKWQSYPEEDMSPLQVLISICKKKSLTRCSSQWHLLYVNKLTEVIKQTVSGDLITGH